MYNFYLDKDSIYVNYSIKRGVFQDLEFISYIRFTEKNKSNIQDLFYWSEDVTSYLNLFNPKGFSTLKYKKT